ncbi:helix-turn-helix domain-containing protein [Rhizohabitans arisaemae]|uniref:helix-turn-helix domain-containing protein n=1 Tax=Rhizohabitans arisaemae TaxID=2720610 RepID=UPI0024B0572A|nr:helix-turn-helix domain-containing protein [Rhizohabitans arisaemae]
MTGYARWRDIRGEQVERAGGEQAAAIGKEALLAEVLGHRPAEIRRTRGLTQREVAERMGVTKGRVSQIEQGKVSGREVMVRYIEALGGRLQEAVYFDDGVVASIA